MLFTILQRVQAELYHLEAHKRVHDSGAHAEKADLTQRSPRTRRRTRAGPTALRAMKGTLESRTQALLDSEAFVFSIPVCP